MYVSKATLFAVPFDLARLEVTGSPAPVVQNVFWNPTEGAAQYTFSSTGVLTYLRGGPEVAKYPVVSVDRRGGTTQADRRGRRVRQPPSLPGRQATRR